MIVLVDSDDNEIADNNSRSVFCSYTEEILTDGVLSVLQREVTFQSHLENYRIRSFIKAKTIMKILYAEQHN